MASALPKVCGGEIIMVREAMEYNQFLVECRQTAIPSFCAYPNGTNNADYRRMINDHDYCMKSIFLIDRYWPNILDYVRSEKVETADGWVLTVSDADFVTSMCQLLGLDKNAFTPSPEREYIKRYSLHCELRENWSKVSNLSLGLGELAHRIRLYPIMLNVFEKHPVVVRNYHSSKIMLDTANELQYKILKYTSENNRPRTMHEIHYGCLHMSWNAPQPFEYDQYQYSAGRVLPQLLENICSPERILSSEICKTISQPAGSSFINKNYVAVAWPNKWEKIRFKMFRTSTPARNNQNDSVITET